MVDVDIDELTEELLQCRRCGICRDAVYEMKGFDGICPIWRNTSGFETSFMRGKIQVALALLDGTLEKNSENAESLYQCTLCGNCAEICGAEFQPAQMLESVRRVFNDIPNEARDRISESISAHDNPYSEDISNKGKWTKDLEFEIPRTGKTLYFVGCTADLRSQGLAKNTARILHTANEEFFIIDKEPCCGSVLLRTGNYDVAKENAKKVADLIEKSNAERIVVSCAGCMKTLKKDYKEKFGIKLPEILHIVEYAAALIEQGKLEIKGFKDTVKVTYHDPCHIGRELGIYEEPRKVLKAIPGVELVEMVPNREATICCGAGGGLRSYDSELSKRIAEDRIDAAEKTHAHYIASTCPFCETNFVSGIKQKKSNMKVIDVVDLLADAI